MPKEKVNYQEVYDLYQLCSETKNLKEFCSEYGINYDKFMNWQRHQLWDRMRCGVAEKRRLPHMCHDLATYVSRHRYACLAIPLMSHRVIE